MIHMVDDYSKQALIVLDFSSKICYTYRVFRNLSVPPLGNAIFMPILQPTFHRVITDSVITM